MTAVSWPGSFNAADLNLTEQIFPLGQLCNADKSARIKFVLQDREGQRTYNEAFTTVEQLMGGNT